MTHTDREFLDAAPEGRVGIDSDGNLGLFPTKERAEKLVNSPTGKVAGAHIATLDEVQEELELDPDGHIRENAVGDVYRNPV